MNFRIVIYQGVKILRKTSLIFMISVITGSLLVIPALAAPVWDRNPSGFEHGLIVDLEGEEYYIKGPGSIPGAVDVPGHTWIQTGSNQFVGRHYNTGPYMAGMGMAVPSWWAPGEKNGILLYIVDAIADKWTPEIAEEMAERGYVHYHEFVSVETGEEHEYLVMWLKHTAVRSFEFAPAPMPMAAHYVTPGIDWGFMPNYMMPYNMMM